VCVYYNVKNMDVNSISTPANDLPNEMIPLIMIELSKQDCGYLIMVSKNLNIMFTNNVWRDLCMYKSQHKSWITPF
jgi:hypothetical protein